MVSFSDIESAYKLVGRAAHKTPLLTSHTFNEISGNEVYFKAENFQRIGAFKFRGAYNKISSLTPEQRKAGVIAHSSGNHAQAVALVCKLYGIKAVIVMPGDSVSRKVEATKGYGAEVVFCGNTTDERERTTDELIRKHGYTLVHPFNDPLLIAGQGTAAYELYPELKELDYLVVPIGGGGLISGCSIAAKKLFPGVKVIGVETEGADDAYQSFRTKTLVKRTSVNTIADGIRTLSVGQLNLEIILKYVDDVITISDGDLFPMMKFFADRMKIVVEPTGAVSGAAVMKRAIGASGKKVCAVISGGNADPELLRKIL